VGVFNILVDVFHILVGVFHILVGVFHILVRTQLVLTEVLHGSLQSQKSYAQAVPHTITGRPFQFYLCLTSCYFILYKPNDSLKKPRLTVQPYYGVAVGRHLQLLRYFS